MCDPAVCTPLGRQVTRRLGLARSRAQPTPTPTVVKRPEDLATAAASLSPADQGIRPADAEDAVPTNSAAATSRSATERDTLRALAQQALQDGLAAAQAAAAAAAAAVVPQWVGVIFLPCKSAPRQALYKGTY
eukprot:scaffold11808_cov24-Tisochrysis_lutea.AAC.2